MLTEIELANLKKGGRISYNDGRGEAGAIVLKIGRSFIVAQFDDRADTTTIRFDDKAWTQFLSVTTN